MTNSRSSLREIVKTSSIYGGVQFVQLGASLIKNKVIAAWLGPEGIAISGYLNQLLQLLSQLLHLGLETVTIRKMGEGLGLSTLQVSQIRKWGLGTALLSGLLTAVFCVPLSELTLGSSAYWPLFLWLALALVFKQLAAIEIAFLQGLRSYKDLAGRQIASSVVALLISIPLYASYGYLGIAIGVVLSMGIPYLFLRVKNALPLSESIAEPLNSKKVLSEGARIALTGLYTALALYVIQIGIQQLGGLQQAGYYQAAFGLLFSYSGMLLAAMSADYLPRLSQVINDPFALQQQVNQQAYVGLVSHVVVSTGMILGAPEIVHLLFSAEFSPAISALQWGGIGVFLRAASISLGFVLIAKGDAKRYLRLGLFTNSFLVVAVLGGYYLGGLTGAAIGFSVYYFLHLMLLQALNKTYYQLRLSPKVWRYLLLHGLLLAGLVALSVNWKSWAVFGLRAPLAIALTVVYLRQFKKQLN